MDKAITNAVLFIFFFWLWGLREHLLLLAYLYLQGRAGYNTLVSNVRSHMDHSFAHRHGRTHACFNL